VHYNP
jgi:hypothetical protein